MPHAGLSVREARDLLLVFGVMAIVLGLSAIASGVLTPVHAPRPDADDQSRPSTISDRVADLPLVASARTPEHLPGVRFAPTVGTTTITSVPGDYLAKMVALEHRRRELGAMTSDPYQMSLNPAVYAAATATARGSDDGAAPDISDG